MRHLTDALLASLIPLLILLHLYYAPYTKVEESFNIQATHDILTFGLPWRKTLPDPIHRYDHVEFSGSVPRTFVGPLTLAGASWPVVKYFEDVDRQILVRGVLGLFNAFCLLYFRNGVAKTFGRVAANWFVLFQASQFHIIYYASRTLPNFFAFGLSVCALHDLLPHFAVKHVVYDKKKRQTVSVHPPNAHTAASMQLYRRAMIILTATGVIFRSELALLLGSHAFYLLIQRRISLDPFQDVIPSCIKGLCIGLAFSVPFDSYFWQQLPSWPELEGFMYNAVNGRAAEWGISPFHFYFSSALPRLLFNPLTYYLCIPIAISMHSIRKPARDVLLPNIFFVFLYSFQPHKEWRFIVYAVPPLLAVAAEGASWIWTRRAKSLLYRFLSLCLVASVFASFASSFAMLAISRLNYPGAEALNRLHTIADGKHRTVSVHMDTSSCMTGITRFLEKPVSQDTPRATIWRYDKTEDEEKLLDPTFWRQFDYVLAESPERVIGKWEVEETVDGYAGLMLLRPGQPFAEQGRGAWAYDGSGSPLQDLVQMRNLRDVQREAQKLVRLVNNAGQEVVRRARSGELGAAVTENWKRFKGTTGKDLRDVDWDKERARAQEWAYETGRRYLTGGWWVKVRMEPKIRILKKQQEQ